MRFSSLSSMVVSCSVVALVACGGTDSSSDEVAGSAAGSTGTGGNTAGAAGKAGTSGGVAAGASGAAGKAGASAGTAGQGGAGQSGTGGASTGGTAGSTTAGAGGATSGAAGTAGAAAGNGGAGAGGKAAGGSAGAAAGKAGSAGTATGGSGGAASDAKCSNAMPCASPDEFCNYSDNLCGASMYVGHCQLRKTGCSAVFTPVCGCDGKVYANSCTASSAGFDLANEGSCAPPDVKLFACGPYFCDKDTQYCEKIGDLPSIADSYECKSLPPICQGVASCDCLDKTICGTFECIDTKDGGHETICPGP